MNIAIILSSGVGKRMGAGKNKTLLTLDKKPLIYYAIENFEKSKLINKIILVVRAGEEEIFKNIADKYGFKKIVKIIAGGKERQDSAYNGLKFIEEKFGKFKNMILLFHNGANPFVAQEELKRVINDAKRFGAAVVAHKTKDTIRKVDKRGLSQGVIDRNNLWNMQTPQAIKFPLALRAFNQAKRDNFLGTDDVSLVERLGRAVKIVEASENNFKVTTPLDLELAKVVLKKIY
ncbi:MAG: 2-C-methyl-D-erythritol 4-phosphate cytidylyltransferase [Candidatus Moranbacteria bacterium]|jgi:2-C-methyl-D-erythritol 4-phosphate cytidylyltransferase|nr:2-C-methyl-D-erythritol 4-phosphate cytidylyltransferase [Candidatus Moranbacteria bacterium]